MCEENQTQVTEILLLGFQGLHKFKTLLFVIFLLVYIVILHGNLIIVFLISSFEHLKIPMFFFLKHLAIADVLITTCLLPLMLDIILMDKMRLLLISCITHLYFCGVLGFVQCFLIAVMSYDRYLAICNPMRYRSMMDPNTCFHLVIGSWMFVTIVISSGMVLVFQLQFCGLNIIDHFYCDIGPLVALSTSDTYVLTLLNIVNSILLTFFPFVFIIITYICILFTILNISSSTGRQKAFSTCSSHLITVCAYYGTLITVYMDPSGETSFNNKFRSLLYIVVTPLMNPILYSLRSHEIRRALQKLMNNIRTKSQ